MRILTMYLPQYHRVKENDEWWGEGYTDWVSTKNAKPLYEGHYQPHVPLNDYYYDLLDRKTFEWQAELMKKYGIDGQCIYHYWFKEGRQILERPAENLLEWKDIDMPYCFSWANQSWANSWSAVKNANIWCDEREQKKKSENDNGLLLEQEYGDEKEWKAHFDYLLPFFKDERYIKIDGKPVFVLYQALFITVLKEMRECWNLWAKQEGFKGIYFIGASNKDESLVDAVLYPGPQMAMSTLFPQAEREPTSNVRILDYSKVWNTTLEMALLEKKGMIGAFVGFDDAPRRGNRGCVIDNASPEVFRENLTKLFAINDLHNQPFTFINAWNEWGEGMHLEPDKRFGMAYLEAVKYARSHYEDAEKNILAKSNLLIAQQSNVLEQYKAKEERYKSYWKILDKWLLLKEKDKSIADNLRKRGIRTVAIYGVGMLGKHLVFDLQKGNIKILYGLDRKDIPDYCEFPIYNLSKKVEETDAVIVTVCYDYENIKQQLQNCGYKNVISLEALLDE